MRVPLSGMPVFQTYIGAGFQSIWYWVLLVVVWTLACYRTLGVPHDMLLRTRRMPAVGERVDLLAHLASERIGGIHDLFGLPIAAGVGFVLASLFVLGFGSGIEAAEAAFVLALPLAVIAYSKLRLALAVRRQGLSGPDLWRALLRRRTWHQVIAVLSMFAAVAVAIVVHAPRLPRP